jgi:hypothetical protein
MPMAVSIRRTVARAAGGFLLWAALFWAGGALGQDILIMRPLDNSASVVSAEQLRFEVEISAFTAIREVKVNGVAQAITPSPHVRVTTPQPLALGRNPILVEVRTEAGSASQLFVVTRIAEGAEAAQAAEEKKPVSLLAVGGVQQTSNAFLTNEVKKSGLKLFLILVPAYEKALDETTRLRFQGIVSRERYFDSDLKDAALQFTQVLGSYIKALNPTDNWSAGGGYSRADVGFDSPLAGKEEFEHDLFAFGALQRGLSGADFYRLEGEYLIRDRKSVADSDYNDDATVLTFKADLDTQLSRFRGRFKGWYSLDDAKGKYADKTVLRLAADLKAPAPILFDIGTGSAANKLVLGAGARLRMQTFATSNPATGKAESDTLIGLAVNGTYPLKDNLLFVGELAQDRQSSNVSGAAYDATTIAAYLVYVY